MKRTVFPPIIGAVMLALLSSSCLANGTEELLQKAERAINNLKSSDSTLTNFFEHSAGYVVFPGVKRKVLNPTGKTVAGIVYENDRAIGEASLAESGLNPQDNTTPFHEVIFFENARALENFKQGRFVMRGEIGAVSAVEGAALTATYRKGVAVFTTPKNGLLESITIGDQQFSYMPSKEQPFQTARAK